MNIKKLMKWLEKAKIGDEVTYHTGQLSVDRCLGKTNADKINHIGNLTSMACGARLIHLIQIKGPHIAKGMHEYSYVAICRSKENTDALIENLKRFAEGPVPEAPVS